MATKSSGKLALSASYTLGDYVFSLRIEPVSGSYSTKYTARCTHGGKTASKSIIIDRNAKSWKVEANEDTATVYVELESFSGTLPHPIATANGSAGSVTPSGIVNTESFPGAQGFITILGSTGTHHWISSGPFTLIRSNNQGWYVENQGSLRTVRGKPVYVYTENLVGNPSTWQDLGSPSYSGVATNDDYYIVLYGKPDAKDEIVGRFKIELKDAGGTGPGSDWDDPGDYDDDRDPEDPTTTLYLTVVGALSGRHNNPLQSPEFSYLPFEKETVKEYGCGGDGGNGGGGGAGASNVVVFKFATNEADHKDITTIAKRHGYGSGGGKGGKGGAGCILIYY